jgi:hypothetical protein
MLCFAERTCGLESYVLKPKQKKQKIAKPWILYIKKT